ncbi:hypothetical protein [Adhaeribacter terreus]|uniref:hypothetical protein n=1 Tax=Adhaeribacter terreus TaxID=529703 RepID=UPI00366BA285
MSLKYLFAFGENRVPNISRNYRFFHIPIDNIIQDKLQKDKKIEKLTQAWSRVNEYETYLNYQIKVRQSYSGQIPMDVEFKLFNQVS